MPERPLVTGLNLETVRGCAHKHFNDHAPVDKAEHPHIQTDIEVNLSVVTVQIWWQNPAALIKLTTIRRPDSSGI